MTAVGATIAAVRKARPTTYKGIVMRSRLEAGFAAWLDQNGLPWEYEPVCFADETGQYLPDFRVDNILVGPLEDGCRRLSIYVEVKPAGLSTTDAVAALRRLRRITSSEPGAALMLTSAEVDQGISYVNLWIPGAGWKVAEWARCIGGCGQAVALTTIGWCPVCQAETEHLSPWAREWWT